MKPHDVLSDKVHIGGPEASSLSAWGAVVDASKVVGEGVEPYIHDMRAIGVVDIGGHWDSPGEVAARDGEISGGFFALETRQDFTTYRIGLNKVFVFLDMSDQGWEVLGHAKKIGLLLHLHQGLARSGVAVIRELGLMLGNEGLFTGVVPSFVLSEIDVTILGRCRPERLDDLIVLGLGGADVAVVRYAEGLVEGLEECAILISELNRLQILSCCSVSNFEAMLV